MNYYEILDVAPNADDKKLKFAYLKAAKKYHPDIYKGVNSTHFSKVNEVYNILKFSHKRKEYDRKMKIVNMRDNKEYSAMAQKMKKQGREFSYQMYEDMKKESQ
jgi:curved DNA-binding protein CbpA